MWWVAGWLCSVPQAAPKPQLNPKKTKIKHTTKQQRDKNKQAERRESTQVISTSCYRWLPMNKQEALAVLHELQDAFKEAAIASCVSLDGSQVSHILTGGYEIKMKCELDSYSREIIKGIIKKHDVAMTEQNGYVILRSLGD
jgi:hypothetical protein